MAEKLGRFELGRVHCGDALELLRELPAESVDCCVTSPPYWGLRDYGNPGQIGLERTPEEYVARLVEVFAEVRRALRPAGTLWLNLGDCYATGGGKVGECPGGGAQGARWRGEASRDRDAKRRRRPAVSGRGQPQDPGEFAAVGPMTQPNRMPIPGLKPKDLVGAPWRVAFALQAAGWYLRADIIWSKPNPMPESVRDRPTKSHEYVFLLAKAPRYYYNRKAVAESAAYSGPPRRADSFARRADHGAPPGIPDQHRPGRPDIRYSGSRNRRSVWFITTKPFDGAHFATFPPELPRLCILAGCPAGGLVLDPFAGSGTAGEVAVQLGRQFLGFDLSPQYAGELAQPRVDAAAAGLPVAEHRAGQASLFENLGGLEGSP